MEKDMRDWGIADNATPPHVYLMVDDGKVLSLPHTEAGLRSVQALAVGQLFVIHSVSELGFWSNDMGWCESIFNADEYTLDEAIASNLPLSKSNDAEWLTVKYE